MCYNNFISFLYNFYIFVIYLLHHFSIIFPRFLWKPSSINLLLIFLQFLTKNDNFKPTWRPTWLPTSPPGRPISPPKAAKITDPEWSEASGERKKMESEWLGSVIGRPFHFYRFWTHFCPSRPEFHRFGMDFSWFLMIFYTICWIVLHKFSHQFLNKSALTFLNIFTKPQPPNPTTLQTIFKKPWPGGMRVSDWIK